VNGFQRYKLKFLVIFGINMLLIRFIVVNFSIIFSLYYVIRFNLFQRNTTDEDVVDSLYFYDMFQLIQFGHHQVLLLLLLLLYYYYHLIMANQISQKSHTNIENVLHHHYHHQLQVFTISVHTHLPII
jgi:Trk-type K+ transport system membrane component